MNIFLVEASIILNIYCLFGVFIMTLCSSDKHCLILSGCLIESCYCISYVSAYYRVYTLALGSSLKLFINRIDAADTGVYNCTGRVDNIPAHWSFELQGYGTVLLQAC